MQLIFFIFHDNIDIKEHIYWSVQNSQWKLYAEMYLHYLICYVTYFV